MKATKTLIAAVVMLVSLPTMAQTAHRNVVNRSFYNTQSFVQDRFAVNGTIRARVDSIDINSNYAGQVNQPTDNASHLNADLWLSARLYKDWTAKMEIEPQLNLKTGKMNGDQDIPMNKLFLEGTVYDKVKLRAGKFGAFSSYGRVLDNEVTGADLTFDYKPLPTRVTVGRVTKQFNDNPWGVGVHRNAIAAVQSKYAINPVTNVGATVAYVKDVTTPNGEKDAWFGEIGADTKFNRDWSGMVAYSVSNLKDVKNHLNEKVSNQGVFAGVKYKNADWNIKNSYDVFLNVRHVGAMSGVSSVEDYSKNVKGIQLGANFVPYKNVKLNAFYLLGKQVDATVGTEKQNVNVFRAQAEYKF